MECVVCGGTNFTKEAGYFFCNECQTQSQEVVEHVFQREDTGINVKTTRKIESTESKELNSITSWECYNVIIYMITEELIDLGVNRSIKNIVKCLWIRYLQKLEVLNLNVDKKPKLPAINMKKDLNIIYGITKKRKRKTSSSSEKTDISETVSKRERTRKKRALAEAEYKEQSIKSKTEGSSLHNETLTSLKSGSDKSVENEVIVFNKQAVKELKKSISIRHLREHKKDLHMDMKCHSLNQLVSMKYKAGIHHVSPMKIYCILYIALLINRDPMQLGDMLRYLREGHLSLNAYTSLFPEHYSNTFLNIQDNNVKSFYSSESIRRSAGNLVKLLGVEQYICSPDLVALSQRYCQEMNLPDEICTAVENVIIHNPPTFNIRNNMIPNYEGRVMSVIIFVLKLLYGLDGMSEINLSNYAKAVNTKWKHLKMFDIVEWMEFINYRKFIIEKYHFPSYITENENGMNSDLFVQYRKSHNINVIENKKLAIDMKGYKDLLTKIEKLQYNSISHIEFTPSLYPSTAYAEVILGLLKGTKDDHIRYILKKKFHACSLDFLLNPMSYLSKLNKNIKYKHGGMNDKWIIRDVGSVKVSLKKWTAKDLKFVPVEIVQSLADTNDTKPNKNTLQKPKKNVDTIIKEYNQFHENKFKENIRYLSRQKVDETLNDDDDDDVKVNYDVHCFPYERYCLNINSGAEYLNKDEFEAHFDRFSSNFQLILKYCAQLTEQTNKNLYTEFQFTELYLIYNGKNYPDAKKRRTNMKLNKSQCYKYW